MIQAVAQWHRVFGDEMPACPVFGDKASPKTPTVWAYRIDPERLRWLLERRRNLIQEEPGETIEALERAIAGELTAEVMCKIADGIVDSIYVLVGAALELGIPLDRVFDEVHITNLRKYGGPVREDGKRLKPEGWQSPDIMKAVYG